MKKYLRYAWGYEVTVGTKHFRSLLTIFFYYSRVTWIDWKSESIFALIMQNIKAFIGYSEMSKNEKIFRLQQFSCNIYLYILDPNKSVCSNFPNLPLCLFCDASMTSLDCLWNNDFMNLLTRFVQTHIANAD